MTESFINSRFWIVVAISLVFATACFAQDRELCITYKPKPALPVDHGTLDAYTSLIFSVEFLPTAKLGKITLVKTSPVPSLADLALEAVLRIRFLPKMAKGKNITIRKMVNYSYAPLEGWTTDSPANEYRCKSPTGTRLHSKRPQLRNGSRSEAVEGEYGI